MFIMVKNRLTKETIEEIKQKREKGASYTQLSIEFKIPTATILYNLNDVYREKQKRNQREYQKRIYRTKVLTPEQKQARNENTKRYFKERYYSDPEFREKHIQRVKEYNKKQIAKKQNDKTKKVVSLR